MIYNLKVKRENPIADCTFEAFSEEKEKKQHNENIRR
jgi:hypothetical protein